MLSELAHVASRYLGRVGMGNQEGTGGRGSGSCQITQGLIRPSLRQRDHARPGALRAAQKVTAIVVRTKNSAVRLSKVP